MNKLNDFPYKNILVLGLAKSGTATSKILVKNNYNVSVNDLKASNEDQVVKELQALGVDVVTGSHPLYLLDNAEVVVKNPGIPYENALIQEAKRREIPVITEIELVHYLISSPYIGITGSNGKTTTTTLTHEMLEQSNKKSKIAGNIGKVAVEVAETLATDETMVVELSSFQLMGTEKFRPHIAVFLNLFQSHIDYHGTYPNYKAAKTRIFENQTNDDYLVYNADDNEICALVNDASAKKIPFSSSQKCLDGAWCDETYIYFKEEPIIERQRIVLVGKHNLENILAAVAASMLAGATKEGIVNVLTTFTGVKHRTQYVENVNERMFYNDSKATNILATSKALGSFEQPIILLAGGLDRGNDFEELIPHLTNVKAMILFGETADKLEKAGLAANVSTILFVETMKEAVDQAYEISNEKDVILLSPACASWDQYRTFEERGDMFTEAVHTLK
ncbi:UDP-N-acetylmuramoylalanine--D-glutamate ligase [Paraliobacillus quinghaiensis]|uniref:UDP-N-acetylmuramoylalanine--D-glutamate ligase n=1 Tax=Paraliobacillus quinghaiensis TaxID=470815 RepID=A0A917TFA1_9BACI|nr:UDP-N-acetylmuramoyl-L-alanine--D-glutamate ligase [Paraliobacillus quinghaiensis]GGM20590.1 UDP-N-acetylmuramoylalanine--D-glutamate ligase [Paraliobacillus quinghaiensis]